MASFKIPWDTPSIEVSGNYSVPGSLASNFLGQVVVLGEVITFEGTVNVPWIVQRVVEAVLSSVLFGAFMVLRVLAKCDSAAVINVDESWSRDREPEVEACSPLRNRLHDITRCELEASTS